MSKGLRWSVSVLIPGRKEDCHGDLYPLGLEKVVGEPHVFRRGPLPVRGQGFR